MQSVIHASQRIVVKVGSSLVTNDGKGLDHAALSRWASEIADLTRRGKQVVLVSSGAIAEGLQRLGWATRPKAVHELQAAAAVGQMGLVQAYETAFRAEGLKTAQVLLTHEDLADRTRYLNARSTLITLLKLNVVPIINENDTVATSEIRFGDNDTLGALVTNLIEADALIILTDQQGLYTADPRKHADAEFVHEAQAGDPRLEDMAGGAGSSVGTGGMITKIIAAKRAAQRRRHGDCLRARSQCAVAAGRRRGDWHPADCRRHPLLARKQWLADHLQLAGRLVLDEGAAHAVVHKGTSLLPIGVVAVEGEFLRGEALACVDPQGHEVARGLVNYSSDETRLIMRHATREIESILGYMGEPELIHRDNMVSV